VAVTGATADPVAVATAASGAPAGGPAPIDRVGATEVDPSVRMTAAAAVGEAAARVSEKNLFPGCELVHTSRPIPEQCCLRVGGSGRSSGECRLNGLGRKIL
jgi:hypothetical protein